MEKTEITLSLDSEKMDALAYYLKKESATAQSKMDEALRQLYESAVPESVREFLDAKSAPPPKSKRPPRSSQPKATVIKAAAVAESQEADGT